MTFNSNFVPILAISITLSLVVITVWHFLGLPPFGSMELGYLLLLPTALTLLMVGYSVIHGDLMLEGRAVKCLVIALMMLMGIGGLAWFAYRLVHWVQQLAKW